MTDQAMQRTVIAATPTRLFEAATDFDSYPGWARDLKSATVLARDDQGRATQVRFRAAAMGRSTSYTLAYEYDNAPDELSWRLVEGDIMRRLDGSYRFEPVDGDPGNTAVVYRLTVELVVPLPGFVKRRAEARIMHTALRELKDYVEAQSPGVTTA
jgi:ribosome-associated toxin RatA of RatAB toxin-antitoxin module